MAVPKYFLPAALAILKRPVLEVSVDSEDDGVEEAGDLMDLIPMQFYRQTS